LSLDDDDDDDDDEDDDDDDDEVGKKLSKFQFTFVNTRRAKKTAPREINTC
jgi:hypothetical protein